MAEPPKKTLNASTYTASCFVHKKQVLPLALNIGNQPEKTPDSRTQSSRVRMGQRCSRLSHVSSRTAFTERLPKSSGLRIGSYFQENLLQRTP